MATRRSEPTESTPDLDVASAVIGNRTKSIIVRHLWTNGPSYGTDILAATGLNGATMSLAMQQLEQWQIVSASIPPEKRHGRAVEYTLDKARIHELVTAWTDFIEGRPA